ncbi:hypothetical protein KC867_00445 [Candidatus Saccharibacteria bacterium]|nr:hypothetical protein [Candidatus Saccharibacteria bacterium]
MSEQLQTIEPESTQPVDIEPTKLLPVLGRLALLQDPEDPQYNDHDGNVVRGYN